MLQYASVLHHFLRVIYEELKPDAPELYGMLNGVPLSSLKLHERFLPTLWMWTWRWTMFVSMVGGT